MKQEELQAILYAGRNRLLAFASLMNRNFSIKKHHEEISEALMAVERGELRKLMIMMPPRSGKSHLASEIFPAWLFWRDPSKFLINCSYSADLSNVFSRNARNMVGSPTFKAVFPDCSLSSDSLAVNQWHTSGGGGYISAGVGGPITGKGWHVLSTDDPLKNQEEADSELMRNKVWDWFGTTMRTRKMDERSSEIVTMTRWHHDDLAGRLLQAEDDWHVIKIPALDAQWASYWPERFWREYFDKLAKEIWPRAWSALYMQEPQLEGGWLFKREYFKYFQHVDLTKVRRITFVDPAISEKKQGDYTSIITIGISGENVLVLNVRRGHMDPKTIIDQVFDVYRIYKPEAIGFEDVAYQRMLIQETRAEMFRRNVTFVLKEVRPQGEKEARISSILHARYVTGKIWHNKTDCQDLENEAVTFPYGKHDDVIDSLASAVRMAFAWGAKIEVFKK